MKESKPRLWLVLAIASVVFFALFCMLDFVSNRHVSLLRASATLTVAWAAGLLILLVEKIKAQSAKYLSLWAIYALMFCFFNVLGRSKPDWFFSLILATYFTGSYWYRADYKNRHRPAKVPFDI